MTRGLKLDFSGGAPVFDFTDRERDFGCTVQRCLVLLQTAEGSDPLFPEGTKLPAMPGAAVLSSSRVLSTTLSKAKRSVKEFAAKHTTPYRYEGLQGLELAPVVRSSNRLSVNAIFTSAEGVVIGQTS